MDPTAPSSRLAAAPLAVTALLAVLSSPDAAAAQEADAVALHDRVDAAVERVTDGVVEIRHRIHANPELGSREDEPGS